MLQVPHTFSTRVHLLAQPPSLPSSLFPLQLTAVCVGWNASHPSVDKLRVIGPQTAVDVSVTWVNPATRPVTCDACVTPATTATTGTGTGKIGMIGTNYHPPRIN